MSNKTSDKNVANVTKSDIDILKALINVYEAGLPNCDELLDSEVKALKKVLAEREQDKARIKELEEELYSANKIVEEYLDGIPKQKIKEKINENSNMIREIEEKIKKEENSGDICEEYLSDLYKEKSLVERDILTLQELLQESEDK